MTWLIFHYILNLLLISSINCNVMILPLYGNVNEKGYYYIEVYIGNSPKQRQTLIVDTGSSLTGFTCKNCTNCGTHEVKPFDLKLSKTSHLLKCRNILSKEQPQNEISIGNVLNSNLMKDCICSIEGKCIYDINYSEGSRISGYYFEDIIEFNGERSRNLSGFNEQYLKNLVLGCHEIEEKLFKYQKASGIIGLADLRSIQGMNSILNNIFEANYTSKKFEKIISILLKSNGGKLVFGSTYHDQIKKKDTKSNLYSILRCKNDERYCSYANDIIIGGSNLSKNLNSEYKYLYKVIFDTGTTLSVFPSQLFDRIHNYIFRSVAKFHPNISAHDERDGITCWKILDKISIEIFPLIAISFVKYSENIHEHEYTKINWTPNSYLYLHKVAGNTSKIYCLGIISNNLIENLNTKETNYEKITYLNPNQIILGTTFFINKEITFYLNTNKILIRNYEFIEFNKNKSIIYNDPFNLINNKVKNIIYAQNELELNRDILEIFEKENDDSEKFIFSSEFSKNKNLIVWNKEESKEMFIFLLSLFLLFVSIFSVIISCWKFLRYIRFNRNENNILLENSNYHENRLFSNTSRININDFLNSVCSAKKERITSNDKMRTQLNNYKAPELLLPVLTGKKIHREENVYTTNF